MHIVVPVRVTRLCGLVLGAVLFSAISWAQNPAPKPEAGRPPALTAEQQQRLKEAGKLAEEAIRLGRDGKFAEAIPLAQKAVAIEREVRGPDHEELVQALDLLAMLYLAREDFPAARKLRQEILEIQSRRRGADHWRVTDARLALAHVDLFARLAAKDRRRLAESDQLSQKVTALFREGKYADALQPAQQALDILKQVLGDKHPDYAQGLNNLAALYQGLGDLAKAEPLFRQALAIRKEILGDKHPDYAASMNNLVRLLESRADQEVAQGEFAAAIKDCKEVVELQTAWRGPRHRRTTEARWALAHVESLAKLTKEQRQRLGDARFLNQRAIQFYNQGKFRDALGPAQRGLAAAKEVLGENHPDYAIGLNNLAGLYLALGAFNQAEPVARQALTILKEVGGEEHPQYAIGLSNLGLLYQEKCDYARAEPLLQQALEVFKNQPASAEMSVNLAGALHNLATLYLARGDFARAEPLFRDIVDLWRPALKTNALDYATSLANLATVHLARDDYRRADPLLRSALDIRQRLLGDTHPETATLMTCLAWTALAQGDASQADMYIRPALQSFKEVLGPRHPYYAWALHLQALVFLARGDPERAAVPLRQGLQILRGNLENVSASPSERQNLARLQGYRELIEASLALGAGAKVTPEQTYDDVLAWKGFLLARQRWAQRLGQNRSLADPEVARLWSEWQSAVGRLGILTAAIPDPKNAEDDKAEQRLLIEQRDRLERELSDRSPEFRRQRGLMRRTSAQVQAALPANTALIDVLEYTTVTLPPGGKDPPQREVHVGAFVVRAGQPIVQVDLGPREPIAAAIERWWNNLGPETGPVGAEAAAAAAELRRRVWEPLTPHLGDVGGVLVSPDGALARFPLAALPGAREGTYLIEELPIAILPVPQLLAGEAANSQEAGPPALVAIGEIDFNASPGRSREERGGVDARAWAQRGAKPKPFEAVAGSAAAIANIRTQFERSYPNGSASEILGAEATEGALNVRVPKGRLIHLETRPFIAPSELASALATRRGLAAAAPLRSGQPGGAGTLIGNHPGLLTGLALAGANYTAPGAGKGNPLAEAATDDGIWTALDIADLDLGPADLVVLASGANGDRSKYQEDWLLELQRAFQDAGARSVIASLWAVDDGSRRSLETSLYTNLWEKRLGPLEALRQAQLSLLHGQPPGTEGESSPGAQARANPRVWAGWVLSGDPGTLPAGKAAGEEANSAAPERRSWLVYLGRIIAGLVILGWLGWYFKERWTQRPPKWAR